MGVAIVFTVVGSLVLPILYFIGANKNLSRYHEESGMGSR
jgi:hypothetical protein